MTSHASHICIQPVSQPRPGFFTKKVPDSHITIKGKLRSSKTDYGGHGSDCTKLVVVHSEAAHREAPLMQDASKLAHTSSAVDAASNNTLSTLVGSFSPRGHTARSVDVHTFCGTKDIKINTSSWDDAVDIYVFVRRTGTDGHYLVDQLVNGSKHQQIKLGKSAVAQAEKMAAAEVAPVDVREFVAKLTTENR